MYRHSRKCWAENFPKNPIWYFLDGIFTMESWFRWPNNTKLHHNQFKELFAWQKDLIKPPPRTQWPNWKVQPFLMRMGFIFSLIWMLVANFSIDEITMLFKSHHTKKWLRKKKNMMDYRHMIFVRKDTHIKYLCALILYQEHIYLKGCIRFML